jgi:hypothetical protein
MPVIGENPDDRARRLQNAPRLAGDRPANFFAELDIRAPPANNVNIPGIVNAPPDAKAAVIRANSGKTLVKSLPPPAVNRRRRRDPVKNMIRINNIVKQLTPYENKLFYYRYSKDTLREIRTVVAVAELMCCSTETYRKKMNKIIEIIRHEINNMD